MPTRPGQLSREDGDGLLREAVWQEAARLDKVRFLLNNRVILVTGTLPRVNLT